MPGPKKGPGYLSSLRMNVSLYESNLSVALGDPGNTTYSSSTIQTVMCLAVRAYRRYRECLRQFGSGVLYAPAISGSNVVYVVGGPYIPGDEVFIDSYANQETFTIESVGPGVYIPNWMGEPISLTLSGDLAANHAAGIRVTMQTPGIQTVAGQPNYQLPTDFVRLDNRTFDLATGARNAIQQVESFYDSVYYYSRLLQGTGWGQSQPFQGGGFAPGPGSFAAVPDAFQAMNVPSGRIGQEMAVDIQPGNPPQMFLTPAPQGAYFWQFEYYAAHQPETVPDEDFDALIDAGIAVAVELTGTQYGNRPNYTEADVTRRAKDNADALLMIAGQALKQFDRKVRLRPFVISG